MKTIAELSEDLAAGRQTAHALLEDCLARAEYPAGEGARVFIRLQAEKARAQADAADRRRAAGAPLSPVDGIPITIKDLFDVEGEVSRAGARIFAQNAPAAADCPAVARLRAAGLVFVGRTNMTEFAYSGLGLNPHFGTPRNPFDREMGRVPGGSSSGAAVSVADGMAAAGMGTDTGGSCRIPAAHVESRRGAVAWALWASLRFLSPLIKPDVRISRIRLPDRLHLKAHGGGPRWTRRRRITPNSPNATVSGKRLVPRDDTLWSVPPSP